MSTAVFFSVPAHGHINPTLPLVAELVAQGETIIYYALDEFQAKIERTGAVYRAYSGMDSGELLGGHPIRTLVKLMKTSEQVIPHLLDELKNDSVDYILYDSVASWGWYVAKMMQLPTVCSTSTFVLNLTTMRELGSPPEMLKLLFSSPISASNELMQRMRRLNQQYNGNNRSPNDVFINQGDLNIVYTSRLFHPASERFDDSYCFVGPSLPTSSPLSDFPMERLDNGRSLIYISLGTLFNERIGFYRNCIDAFRDSPYQVVMSIGNKIDTAVLPAPDNFIITNYAPQIDLLKRASLFITHGGMNSISEGFYFNVPMLVYPQMIEQGFVAERVTAVGAGHRLTENEVNPTAIRNHALKILTANHYQQAAETIGASLREAGGYKRAAAEIMVFK